jgi:hypothetical protein
VPFLQRGRIELYQGISRVLKIDLHKNYQGIYRVEDSYKVQILENSDESNVEPESNQLDRVGGAAGQSTRLDLQIASN